MHLTIYLEEKLVAGNVDRGSGGRFLMRIRQTQSVDLFSRYIICHVTAGEDEANTCR
jgi:hypothetical protein